MSFKNKFLSRRNIQKILLFVDATSLLLSLALAVVFRLGLDFLPHISAYNLALTGLIGLMSFYVLGCYNWISLRFQWKEVSKVFFACVIFYVALSIFIFSTRSEISGIWGRGVIGNSIAMFFVLAVIWRSIIFSYLRHQFKKTEFLVLSNLQDAEKFWQELSKNNLGEQYYFLLNEKSDQIPNERILGTMEQFKEMSRKRDWAASIVSLSESEMDKFSHIMVDLRFSGILLFNMSSYYELTWFKVPVFTVSKSWFAFSDGFQLVKDPVGLRVKRLLDLIFSSLLFLLSFPIMFLTALIVKLDSRGPAIYKQIRTGANGRDFTIYKFRTMREDAEKDGAQWATKKDTRITRVGNLLRKTRLDELPQLWNVMRGDMSFIGPRPERPEFNKELEKQIPHYNIRHVIKPGVTGWAQVMYSYGASVEDSIEKLQYDLYYIKNQSLFLDMRIVVRTIRVVLGLKGR